MAVLSVVRDSYEPLHFMLLFTLQNLPFPPSVDPGGWVEVRGWMTVSLLVADLNNPPAPLCPA